MLRRDDDAIGLGADLLARLRLGRTRGLEGLAGAGVFAPVLDEMVRLARLGPEDNVLVLGALQPGLVGRIAPRCLRVTFADDLSDEDLTRLEKEHDPRSSRRIQFMRGKDGSLPAPQGTVDRILAFNWIYRARVPEAVTRGVEWVSHHDCRVVFCEPSVSLDMRTARKYSREADFSMEDHRALLAYARTALVHRRFTPEGLRSMFARRGMKDIETSELLHGLVVAVTGRFEF